MIVVDIETSGTFDPYKIGIWQIGAIELENPNNIFIEESRIDEEDIVEKGAMIVTGKSEKEMRDESKQTQKQLLYNFFQWAKNIESKALVAHNSGFDHSFLVLKAKKYGLEFPFGFRIFDLQTIASVRYYQINGTFFIEKGLSKMNLGKVLEFCGIPEDRIQVVADNVIKQGKPHNALEDAKLEAEAFSRLIYGKELLKEFSKYPIPDYLK